MDYINMTMTNAVLLNRMKTRINNEKKIKNVDIM